MPATIPPGYASPVCSTTASSDFSIHIPPSPIRLASPLFSSDWMTSASCPVASITSSDSSAIGSTHVISCGSACTGVQLITTPPTRFSSRMTTSSKDVMFWILAPASIVAGMSLLHACGPGVTNRFFENSSYGRPLGPPPPSTPSDSAYRSRSLVNPLRIARVTSASLAGWKRGMVPPWDSLQPKMGILQFLVPRRDKRYILGYRKRYQESGECEHPAVSIESLRGEKAPPASRNLDRDLPDGVRGDEDPEPIPRREELHVRHHAQPVLAVARIESLHARRARVRLEVPDRVVRVVGWKADEVPARAQGHRLSARWPRALEVQRAGRSDLNPERHGVVDDSQVVPRPRRVVSPPRVGARRVVRADHTVATRHRGQNCRTRC